MIGHAPIPTLGTLIVKARDLAGRPVAGLPIDIRYAGGTPYMAHATDAWGEVRLVLMPRRYLVGPDDERCFPWDRGPHPVDVRSHGVTRVVLTLPLAD